MAAASRARRVRTDRDVVTIQISQRKLQRLSIRIQSGLFRELRDESACSLQRQVEIIDEEEQQEAIAWRAVIGAHQWRMIFDTPSVQAEQDCAVGIDDLTEVVMSGRRQRLTEQRLVPRDTGRHVGNADDGPCAFHAAIVALIRSSITDNAVLVTGSAGLVAFTLRVAGRYLEWTRDEQIQEVTP